MHIVIIICLLGLLSILLLYAQTLYNISRGGEASAPSRPCLRAPMNFNELSMTFMPGSSVRSDFRILGAGLNLQGLFNRNS